MANRLSGRPSPPPSPREEAGFRGIRADRVRAIRGTWILASVIVIGGCSRDVRLAGRTLRTVTVGTTTHYGVTLDQDATPEQVAFVLLRAIRDDFTAKSSQERDAALDVQFDVAAVNVIDERNRGHMNPAEHLFHVVYRWTPTVSHYWRDFETEWDRAKDRFVAAPPKTANADTDDLSRCEVRMQVSDPGGDPNAGAVLVIWMARDHGYWRVTHLGFDPAKRELRVTKGG